MSYPYMFPPFEMKDFEDMNKKEAKQHFEWYVSEIPNRIEVLSELTVGKVNLNYSPDSLIQLFTWFLSTITIYQLSDEEIEAELDDLRQYPDFVFEDEKEKLLANPVELKTENYALAMDIAIYYGETLIRNYPQVHWTYFTKPKSYAFLNEPIIQSIDKENWFERNPRRLLHVLIQDIKTNEINNKTLHEMFLMDVSEILEDYDD